MGLGPPPPEIGLLVGDPRRCRDVPESPIPSFPSRYAGRLADWPRDPFQFSVLSQAGRGKEVRAAEKRF